MKILGIDPGIATTGFAIVEKSHGNLTSLDFGVISTPKNLKLETRLLELADDLRGIIRHHKPDLVAVESLFFCNNQKTAIAVAEARGVILLVATELGVKVCEFTPLQVKQSVCGYGKADKRQVQKMVCEIYSLEKIPKPDDAADALAIAFAAS
jgi:crossover junction endodeoxyribonuclease RuvC